MKLISQLSIDLEKASKKVIDNLIQAQEETAQDIWNEVVSTAPMKTGEFITSIEIEPTKVESNEISTVIGSDLTVTSLSGKKYNLGQLLEIGTRPHDIEAINAGGLFWGEYDDEGNPVIVKKVHHPGTPAYNFYRNALNQNKTNYRNRINKAVKEGMK